MVKIRVKFLRGLGDRLHAMKGETVTYQTLFELKYKHKVPTIELNKKFPKDREKISRLALLELPSEILKSVVKDEKQLTDLQALRQTLFNPK